MSQSEIEPPLESRSTIYIIIIYIRGLNKSFTEAKYVAVIDLNKEGNVDPMHEIYFPHTNQQGRNNMKNHTAK